MFSYKFSFLTQIGPNRAKNWYIPSQKGRIKTRDLRNCAYLKMGVCVTAWCSIALHVCVRVRACLYFSHTYIHTFRHREEHSLTQTRTRRNETRKQNKERQKKTHSAERGPTLQNNHKCTRKKEVFVLKKQNKKSQLNSIEKRECRLLLFFFSRLHFMVALALLLQMMRFFRGFASLFSLCPGMPSFSEQLFCLKTKVR